MLFSSIDYFIFLGFALTIFWALRNFHAPRLGAIFALSCLFYMASHPTYIGLLLVSTVLDYWIGQRIDASDDEKVRKRWVALSVASNLGLLGFFKYSNFFIDSLNDGAKLFGYELNLPLLPIILPVGISFYTFQTMSYTIDIYRRQLNPAKNFLEFAVFVTYFPQLVAGPIVRASELLPQLEKRPALRRELVGEGIFLILTGLTKKIVVADYLSVNLVDRAFANPELYTAPEMVVALYAFTAQIYCDFSG
ncbi:MAG: MBOAT family protein, partial [Sandaracinaceae bacterium]|nr:MBOAT family protein [Sandaracinaceae bacterium]